MEEILIPKNSKLNIRFHNPNTIELTADYMAKVFIEVNKARLDRILKEESLRSKLSVEKEAVCYEYAPCHTLLS